MPSPASCVAVEKATTGTLAVSRDRLHRLDFGGEQRPEDEPRAFAERGARRRRGAVGGALGVARQQLELARRRRRRAPSAPHRAWRCRARAFCPDSGNSSATRILAPARRSAFPARQRRLASPAAVSGPGWIGGLAACGGSAALSLWFAAGKRASASAERTSHAATAARRGKRSAGETEAEQAQPPSRSKSDGGEPNRRTRGGKSQTPGARVCYSSPRRSAICRRHHAARARRAARAPTSSPARTRASPPSCWRATASPTPLLAYHDHNAERMRPLLLERAAQRRASSRWSPTPARRWSPIPASSWCARRSPRHLPVTTLPGPRRRWRRWCCRACRRDRFLFAGFLPPQPAARRRRARASSARCRRRSIFFEGAVAACRRARRHGGDARRPAGRGGARADQALRGGAPRHAARLAAHYRAAGPPRGEIVVSSAPPPAEAPARRRGRRSMRSCDAALAG